MEKFFNIHDLGLGRGTGSPRELLGAGIVSEPKGWIQLALAAGSLASSLIGGAKAAQAAKRAERRQRQREAEENAWYTRRYNEDYIDTAAGQNLVRRAKEFAKSNWKKAQGAQAVAGGTDAATAMAKDAGNKMVGETLANVAATDQSRKAQVDAMHRQAQEQYAQMDMNREVQRANAITQAAQGASNAMMTGAVLLDDGSNLVGGSNKGTETTTTASTTGNPNATTTPVGAPAYYRADGTPVFTNRGTT